MLTMAVNARYYISNYLRNGTAVGVVSFAEIPKKLAEMSAITNDETRANLEAVIPNITEFSSAAGISDGLWMCQKV